MSRRKQSTVNTPDLTPEFERIFGVRRAMTLRRIVKQTSLPPEALLDLALEILDLASRKLAPPPIQRQAVGLGTARWRHVSPEQRSEIARRAVQARWAKSRANAKKNDSAKE